MGSWEGWGGGVAWHLFSSAAVNAFIFKVDCLFEVVALATKLKWVSLKKRKPTDSAYTTIKFTRLIILNELKCIIEYFLITLIIFS